MKVKVSRIEPLQLGKLLAVIYALVSLIMIPFLLISLLAGGGGSSIMMVIFLPVLYIVLGFIGGIIGAFVYNLAASWIGGMEVEFDTDQGV